MNSKIYWIIGLIFMVKMLLYREISLSQGWDIVVLRPKNWPIQWKDTLRVSFSQHRYPTRTVSVTEHPMGAHARNIGTIPLVGTRKVSFFDSHFVLGAHLLYWSDGITLKLPWKLYIYQWCPTVNEGGWRWGWFNTYGFWLVVLSCFKVDQCYLVIVLTTKNRTWQIIPWLK